MSISNDGKIINLYEVRKYFCHSNNNLIDKIVKRNSYIASINLYV